jgi:AcrR family transcriptional regulator
MSIAIATPRAALSAKGERSAAEILKACVAIISEQGVAAMSQDAVARRAGISQSALRHHFQTKDALLEAVFRGANETHRAATTEILLDPQVGASDKLHRLIESHMDFIARGGDAYHFEAQAHAARDADARDRRNTWYCWLAGHYAVLIRQSKPHLDEADAEARAFQILTLILGSWVTLGRSRPDLLGGRPEAMKAALLGAVGALLATPS